MFDYILLNFPDDAGCETYFNKTRFNVTPSCKISGTICTFKEMETKANVCIVVLRAVGGSSNSNGAVRKRCDAAFIGSQLGPSSKCSPCSGTNYC